MSLTVRHAATAVLLIGCAALASGVTIPAAVDRTDHAATLHAQAGAVRALPATKPAPAAQLRAARLALPEHLTSEAAVAAVAAAADKVGLTWSTLSAAPAQTTPVTTTVTDATVTTVRVTASVTGSTSAVTSLLLSLTQSAPLMTLSDLSVHPTGTDTSRADITIAVHGAQLPDRAPAPAAPRRSS